MARGLRQCRECQNDTPMHTKDLIVNYDRQRQEVKHIREYLPHLGAMILPHTFRVEAVTLCNASGFMISSDEMNPVGVA